ncbi:MAG: histidine kinase dimerization/phospho-acceptor domain-containing protein [Ilumatobacteraceae bacterium]
MSPSPEPFRAHADGAAAVASVEVLTDDGVRLLIDSEALQQAVYLYKPVFDAAGTIVDLEIVMVNEAARHVLLSEHIVEGVRVSEVFVDVHAALDAANEAWNGRRPDPYRIERRGVHRDRPTTMRYEVSTMRAADHIVQVSVDTTIIEQLASADQRFRLMAEASIDGLMLLEREIDDAGEDVFVLSYANPRALVAAPQLRIGEPLPPGIREIVVDAVAELREVTPVRRYLQREVLARRVSLEATFTEVGDDQVMMSVRELTSRESARAELERSDRVLRAIGEGAFGTIAVFEPQFERRELVELTLLWSAAGQGQSTGHRPLLDPTSVFSPAELLQMARTMLEQDQVTRSGWVPVVGPDAEERSVEFTLVLAGDRFVLEFVERTEELAARTQLAMVTATAEAQRAFLSRISHEMRSPLNVIHGYTQLLAELRLIEPAGAHVGHIQRGVGRMVQIVDDLLLLGQLDQGLVRLDEQRVPVADLVDDVLAAAADEPWWQPHRITRTAGRQEASVVTDRSRFLTAAVLLAEASLAIADGGIEIGEFVRGTRAGIQFVADASAPVVRALWVPFAQSHTIPGSGLAMAVARGMARTLDVLVEVRPVADDPSRSRLVLSLPGAV